MVRIGKYVRIGPNRLITSDADFLRSIFGIRSPFRRPKSQTGCRLQPNKDTVLTLLDEDLHQAQRAKLANAYNGRNNPRQEAIVDEHISKFIELVRARYISNGKRYKPLDLGIATTVLAVDMASELAFGHPIQDTRLCDKDLTGYMSGMSQSLPVMQALLAFPSLIHFSTSKFCSKLVDKSKNATQGLGYIYGFARDRTKERFTENKFVNTDILGGMVARGMSLEEAESESLLAAMAGADPVGTAIRVNLLYIFTNLRVHTSLLTELDTQSLLSLDTPTACIPYQTIRSLPYLSSIIKESLRIFPPFVGLMEKVVPRIGAYTTDNRYLPPGTLVGANMRALLRDEDVFGADAECFRPERWLEARNEEKTRMERSLELVFSGGRYTCIGKEVAIMEIYKVVVEVVRRFEMEIIDPTRVWESVAMGIFVQRGMWVRFVERKGGNV
ncbi:MAG: hypothetical protein Q9167_003326 [Letrouitia subvulpina]